MSKLTYWDATWSLDEKQCPCDIHFLDYLDEKKAAFEALATLLEKILDPKSNVTPMRRKA